MQETRKYFKNFFSTKIWLKALKMYPTFNVLYSSHEIKLKHLNCTKDDCLIFKAFLSLLLVEQTKEGRDCMCNTDA